jgi:hypothetical protein
MTEATPGYAGRVDVVGHGRPALTAAEQAEVDARVAAGEQVDPGDE